MANFIPEMMFVGYQIRGVDRKLSFMTPYSKEKSFEKRLDTVTRWCDSSIKPEIVTNEPTRGFKIDDNIRRYRTDNVVWELTHPKGYNFQITSENLCELLHSCEILNGEIQQELTFVRCGAENYLTTTSSEVYKNAIKQELYENKVSIKDLKIGDKVTLKTGETVIYYGKYHTFKLNNVGSKSGEYEDNIKEFYKPENKSKLFTFYKNLDTNYFHVVTTLNVISIDGHDNSVTDNVAFDTINKVIINNQRNEYNNRKDSNLHLSYNGYGYSLLGLSKKPFKLKDLKSTTENIVFTSMNYSANILVEENNDIYSCYIENNHRNKGSFKYNYYEQTKIDVNGTYYYVNKLVSNSRSFYSSSYYLVSSIDKSITTKPSKFLDLIYTL